MFGPSSVPMGGPSSSYVPSLDGLRALAVVAVIIYHSCATWLPGGLQGVTVFFVLSGYLITSLLIVECIRDGKIDLPHFWLRRARRLLPAIIIVIAACAILFAIFAPSSLNRLKSDTLPALFFVSNWWFIFQDLSYFEAAAAPSPLGHFWSLAIEEQFYIIWPLLLLLLFKLKVKRKPMMVIIGVLIAISVGDMALLYVPGGDPSRVYYGTDTRCFSLLLGAILAFAFPMGRFKKAESDPSLDPGGRLIGPLGLVGLAGLIAVMLLVDGMSSFWYYGGIFLASACSALAMLAIVKPGTILFRVFRLRPLVWIGQRSYGLYLWHFPLLLLMNPLNRTTELPWWGYIVQWAVVFVVAAISYRFVEDPIRHGALGRFFKAKRAGDFIAPGQRRQIRTYLIGLPVLALVTAGCLLFAPRPLDMSEDPVYAEGAHGGAGFEFVVAGEGGEAGAGEGEGYVEGEYAEEPVYDAEYQARVDRANVIAERVRNLSLGKIAREKKAAEEAAAAAKAEEERLANESRAEKEEREAQEAAQEAAQAEALSRGVLPGDPSTWRLLLIGDSVAQGAQDEFVARFPNSYSDSAFGRTIFEGVEVYSWYGGYEWDAIIICLFTNSPIDYAQVTEITDYIPTDKPVYLINSYGVGNSEPNNAVLAQVAADHPNIHIIDWYSQVPGHNEWIASDGFHLTDSGRVAFVDTIQNTLTNGS